MKVGDTAPDFELPDETATPRRLSELLATGPVVLFFYPAAMTFGCTRESCHFRDLTSELRALGARQVGISADPVDKQKQFSDKHAFDYPLLSDPDGAVAGAYGVRRRFGPMPTRRTTFVIGPDARILEIIKSELRFGHHGDRALDVLRNASRA